MLLFNSVFQFKKSLGSIILGLAHQYKKHSRRRVCVCSDTTTISLSTRISNHQHIPSKIRIGSHTIVMGNLEVFAHGGCIRIGDNCFIGEGTRLWSAERIEIGDRVLISHNVNIIDWNSHSISAKERHAHFIQIKTTGHPSFLSNVPSAPIIIESDAWISFGATILRGVKIGKGAIIGANACVTKDVAPYTIIVGNPQRVVGHSLE